MDTFKVILDKLSSYQLFNYFFPGILWVNAIEYFTIISFPNEDILLRLFIYYFVGLIISRFGSLVVEYFYKGFGWVIYSDYGNYLKAESKDQKLSTLSAENNTYRTLLSAVFLFLIVYGVAQIPQFEVFNESKWSLPVYTLLLVWLFSKSYNKQTSFVRYRVHDLNEIDDKKEREVLKQKQKERFLKSINPFIKKKK